MDDGMQTGFDLLSGSRELQIHWFKRTTALLIDLAIVAAPISLAFMVKDSSDVILAGVLSGLGLFLYSTLLEGIFGQTWGKKLMGLAVVTEGHSHSLVHASIRSVPKFFWYIFLPFDALAGLAMVGDPRQRFTDRIASTKVIALAAHKKSKALKPSNDSVVIE
ncbi:MAG: RDD family protein [Methanomassiliicoccales archaeon]